MSGPRLTYRPSGDANADKIAAALGERGLNLMSARIVEAVISDFEATLALPISAKRFHELSVAACPRGREEAECDPDFDYDGLPLHLRNKHLLSAIFEALDTRDELTFQAFKEMLQPAAEIATAQVNLVIEQMRAELEYPALGIHHQLGKAN